MSGAAMARFGAKRGVWPPSRWPRSCRQRELDLNSLVLLVGQAVPEWPAGPSRIDVKALAELTKQ